MTSLHPRDEIAIRQSTCQITLTAKQIEAAELQAKLNEWLASSGQIEHPPIGTYKHVPFQITSDETKKVKSGYKPKNPPERVKRVSVLHERGVNHRANIIDFVSKAGHPVSSFDIAEHMGMTRDAVQHHITLLIDKNLIRTAGKRRHAQLYEVTK